MIKLKNCVRCLKGESVCVIDLLLLPWLLTELPSHASISSISFSFVD